jgi:hypothetical protein
LDKYSNSKNQTIDDRFFASIASEENMFRQFRILFLILAAALSYSFQGSNRTYADGWTSAPVAGNPGISTPIDGKAAGLALGSVYQNTIWPNSSKP